jgi:mono/diheme cytochrome c family protein
MEVMNLLALALLAASQEKAAPVDFDRQIRPILSENCFHCHGPDARTRKADLRLDTSEGLYGKRDETAPVVPGRPGESELIRRVASKDRDEAMPPAKSNRKLTAEQVDLLRRWVAEGAPWKGHWSFAPPRRPEPPKADGPARTPIDAFILARLGREGLALSPEADRATLLRRASLDLTGLPPTPEEVGAFLADPAPDAYERQVDRLLASPRYGEHMAWPWLAAARYSDTNGYQGDGTRTMWPWRDWLVDALNRNKPFDEFTVEQLAGDLLPHATAAQKIATAFHRNHMLNGEGGRIAEESRVDYVADRVDTTATVWLGLTAGCARCHDHKYDPVTQKEYYRLFAYFNNLPESGGVDRRRGANPAIEMPTREQTEKIAALKKSLGELDRKLKELDQALRVDQPQWEQEVAAKAEKLPKNIAELLRSAETQRNEKQARELTDYYLGQNPGRKRLLEAQEKAKKDLKAAEDSVTMVMVMEERPKPRDTFLLVRGAYDKYGEKVTAGVPSSLPPLPEGAPANRLGLARWLVDPGHPLTARVTVNRYWQQFFGTGLVKTVEDFGTQGERPSHPELLDWLATEFVRTGWDVKAMHRLMVTSAVYRQSSRVTPKLLERDPENRLLARGPRFRLASSVLRDQALAVSGLLVERAGGPSVRPYQPPGIWEEMSFGNAKYQQDKGEAVWRRSLYVFWRRTVGPANFFDMPGRQVCTVRETRTNTPLHALTLLNDVTYVEAARVLGQRMVKDGGTTGAERVAYAFRRATARKPSGPELEILAARYDALLARFRSDPAAAGKFIKTGDSPVDPALDPAELAACAGVASVILNLDEVLTKE